MCEGCWDDYVDEGTAPSEITPKVRELAAAITAVYDATEVGGALHVVLDDWNLDDEVVQWWVGDPSFDKHGRTISEAEQHCHDLLAKATVAERATANALSNGFIHE